MRPGGVGSGGGGAYTNTISDGATRCKKHLIWLFQAAPSPATLLGDALSPSLRGDRLRGAPKADSV